MKMRKVQTNKKDEKHDTAGKATLEKRNVIEVETQHRENARNSY